MRTQTITQALSALALTGLVLSGSAQPQPVSGERALLNRSELAASSLATVSQVSWNGAGIDPARALLGQSIGGRGIDVAAVASASSTGKTAGEAALLGRGGGR